MTQALLGGGGGLRNASGTIEVTLVLAVTSSYNPRYTMVDD